MHILLTTESSDMARALVLTELSPSDALDLMQKVRSLDSPAAPPVLLASGTEGGTSISLNGRAAKGATAINA